MLQSKVIKQTIEAFEKRLKKHSKDPQPYLYLAYHAAFPLSLTPDLLYRIWANFKQDIHEEPLEIPWTAVADILISPLCKQVGYELYEMDRDVRTELLKRLQDNPKFGEQRCQELSEFLLLYIQPHLDSEDPDVRDLAQVQLWTALAYQNPQKVATLMAQHYAANPNENLEYIWLESLITALDTPLQSFPHLLHYAQGMGSYGRGDIETATEQLMLVPSLGNKCWVAGVPLTIPKAVQNTRSWQRRQFLKWVRWGLVTLLGSGVQHLTFSNLPITE
ncbi:MAG: hypothetical protein AB4060_06245 [Crocosphaera sp.]